MKTKRPSKQESLRHLREISKTFKGLVDEMRVQVHLGAMEFKEDAQPYLQEVKAVSEAATKDFLKRSQELKTRLEKLRATRRSSSRARP